MSPLEISIAIHYHVMCEDRTDLEFSAQKDIIGRFLEEGLLVKGESHQKYEPTDKLAAYVNGLCNVPMPEQVWVVK